MTLSLSRNRKNEGTCQKKHGMIKSLRCRWEVLSPTAINNRQAPVAQMDRAALWCEAVSETITWNHWEKGFSDLSIHNPWWRPAKNSWIWPSRTYGRVFFNLEIKSTSCLWNGTRKWKSPIEWIRERKVPLPGDCKSWFWKTDARKLDHYFTLLIEKILLGIRNRQNPDLWQLR